MGCRDLCSRKMINFKVPSYLHTVKKARFPYVYPSLHNTMLLQLKQQFWPKMQTWKGGIFVVVLERVFFYELSLEKGININALMWVCTSVK